jgi:hypothetical protein
MLIELVTIFILVIITLLVFYAGAILIVQHLFHKTQEQAKKQVDDFISSIINALKTENSHTPYVYDVMIGSNGICIRDEVLNRLFASLDSVYGDWYYDRTYYLSENVVTYQFRVFNYKKDVFDRKLVIYRVRQIAEKALVAHWHERGIYNLTVDGFIAVTVYADVLRVHIAFTDKGFSEIANIREQAK